MSLSAICASFDGKCFYPGFEVQLCGVILKKNSKSSKLKRKVAVIRDGFFLMFREDGFSQNSRLNYIPFSALEGLVPLGKAKVVADGDNENPYCFRISSTEIQEDFIFSVAHPQVLNRWLNAFKTAQSITFDNLTHWESYPSLQEEHAKVSQENMRYRELFKTLTDRNEELLQLNKYLDGEREALANSVENLQIELENIRLELQQTPANLQPLERDKSDLQQENTTLEVELQANKELEDVKVISERLETEKAEVVEQLKKKEIVFLSLEREKDKLEEKANELSGLLKSLEEENRETQNRLADETLARQEAEQRLRDAEIALSRLQESICNKDTGYPGDVEKEMSVDVSKLKSFFEVRSSSVAPGFQSLSFKGSREPRFLVNKREPSFRQEND